MEALTVRFAAVPSFTPSRPWWRTCASTAWPAATSGAVGTQQMDCLAGRHPWRRLTRTRRRGRWCRLVAGCWLLVGVVCGVPSWLEAAACAPARCRTIPQPSTLPTPSTLSPPAPLHPGMCHLGPAAFRPVRHCTLPAGLLHARAHLALLRLSVALHPRARSSTARTAPATLPSFPFAAYHHHPAWLFTACPAARTRPTFFLRPLSSFLGWRSMDSGQRRSTSLTPSPYSRRKWFPTTSHIPALPFQNVCLSVFFAVIPPLLARLLSYPFSVHLLSRCLAAQTRSRHVMRGTRSNIQPSSPVLTSDTPRQ